MPSIRNPNLYVTRSLSSSFFFSLFYSEHVLNKLIHRYISKAVKEVWARPSVGVEPPELPEGANGG